MEDAGRLAEAFVWEPGPSEVQCHVRLPHLQEILMIFWHEHYCLTKDNWISAMAASQLFMQMPAMQLYADRRYIRLWLRKLR